MCALSLNKSDGSDSIADKDNQSSNFRTKAVDSADTDFARRTFLKLAGVAGAAGLASGSGSAQPTSESLQNDEFELIEATISEIRQAIVSETITATSLVEQYLERIEEYDETLNAFITVNENAVARAEELDETFEESGPVGPLHGVPVVLKDNYDTSDMPTTGGSLTLEGFVPAEDAFQVMKLREAGAVILGKGNMDEWAHGGAPGGGYSSLGGQTVNPYDTDRGPSGSSGGPAVAVAANLGVVGMGSDTGGSIRGPVADNCLVGIKSTLGLTSRSGIIPFGLSLDVGGPMTRTVTDAAVVLGATTGVDPDDPDTYKSVDRSYDDYTQFLKEDALDGATIGVARDFFGGNEEIDEAVDAAIETMAEQEAEIVDPVTFPQELFDSTGDIYSTISDLEFKNYLNEYLAERDAPVESLQEIIELSSAPDFPIDETVLGRLLEAEGRGSFTDQFYQRTLETGPAMISRILLAPMEEHDLDALVAPTSTCPAEPLPSADDVEVECEDTPWRTGLNNISGFPDVSVPAGFTSDGLPISVSFTGPEFSEPTLLALAYAYEQASMERSPPEGFEALDSDGE